MRNRIIATVIACLMAANVAAVTYKIGRTDGEDRIMSIVCEQAGKTWERETTACR